MLENKCKKPTQVRWIDVNKGDKIHPNYRSRFVAKEINTYKRIDLFAAAPPLEAVKMLLSMVATNNNGEVVMVNDVSRAFFHAKVKRDVYVELPQEDQQPGDEGMCAKMEYSLYGTRDAAVNWHDECSQQLVSNGFLQGKASPCVLYHPQKRIRTVVHGGDYVSSGKEQDLKWMKARLEDEYDLKTKWLGPEKHQQQEVRVLNRIISWEKEGIGYDADPRHVEVMVEELGLKNCTTVGTPGTSTEGRTKDSCSIALASLEETRYRALVARANHLAPDRADIAFAAKELAKSMSKPIEGVWTRLKRLGRYFAGRPRMQIMLKWQEGQDIVKGFTHADWAGDKEARKSTIGGCTVVGDHLIKAWATTQTLIAVSSAESGLYATLPAVSETLGLISMAKDLGYTLKGQVLGDANAALGIIRRKGLGKTRHIDTSHLWVQQIAAERRLLCTKILGKENPADLFTKYLDNMTVGKHVAKLNCKYIEGRASSAPQLHTISISWSDHMRRQGMHALYKFERVSMQVQHQIQPTYKRTSKVSQGYLLKMTATREQESNERIQALRTWNTMLAREIHHDQTNHECMPRTTITTTTQNNHNYQQRRRIHIRGVVRSGTLKFSGESTTGGPTDQSVCCLSPTRMKCSQCVTSAIAVDENIQESLRGGDNHLHNDTTTVRVETICKCTGELCQSSPISSNASGHCLRGGLRDIQVMYRQTYQLTVEVTEQARPAVWL